MTNGPLSADGWRDGRGTLSSGQAGAGTAFGDDEGVVTSEGGLRQGWFRVTEPEPGVYCIEEPLHTERVKSFLVVGSRRALLIDTGMGVGDLRRLVRELTDRPLTVVQSHAHFDHMGSTHQFAADCEVLVHPAEAEWLRAGAGKERVRRAFAPKELLGPLPDGFRLERFEIPGVVPSGFVGEGDRFDLGGREIEVLEVPGHCVGLLAFLDRAGGVLWGTGAAYPGALYAQMDDSDLDAYRVTMQRLADLAPALRTVYPAHGESPMDPSLLPRMRDALDEVAAGRRPDLAGEGIATHRYDGFSVIVAGDGA